MIGIEEYPIPHVQGHKVGSYRLFHEQQMLIATLMRGGEPIALGVNNTFPRSMLIHTNELDDIRGHHLQRQANIVLVDSIINNGNTVIKFVQRIRKMHTTIRIVIVVGVAQGRIIAPGGTLSQALAGYGNISLVALRTSDNKFTGQGTTDIGNRLFNTMHLLD